MIKFGSHNSWTYRKPTKWWMNIIRFMGRCQDVDIYEQFKKHGITVFDLRVKFIDGKPYIHHGIFNFGEFDEKDLDFLNTNYCALRIILESNGKMKNQEEQEKLFIEFCASLEENYPKIKFFGGNRKYDWKKVYTFKHNDLPLSDLYSSTTSLFKCNNKFLKVIDDLYPRFYAELKNRENYRKYMEKGDENDKILFYDFVGKYI